MRNILRRGRVVTLPPVKTMFQSRAVRQLSPLLLSRRRGTVNRTMQDASALIDRRIADLNDWRGTTLAHIRKLILAADPDVIEEWKWRGVPVWSQHGILCTGETYKAVVKLTFAKGASLHDPAHLFNSSLDGNVRRAIDIHEGEAMDESAFQQLIRDAIAFNAKRKK